MEFLRERARVEANSENSCRASPITYADGELCDGALGQALSRMRVGMVCFSCVSEYSGFNGLLIYLVEVPVSGYIIIMTAIVEYNETAGRYQCVGQLRAV